MLAWASPTTKTDDNNGILGRKNRWEKSSKHPEHEHAVATATWRRGKAMATTLVKGGVESWGRDTSIFAREIK